MGQLLASARSKHAVRRDEEFGDGIWRQLWFHGVFYKSKNYLCQIIEISFSILIFHRFFFFFNCTWISKQYSVLSEHKLSCIHEKVCNTLSLSAYTCSTADGSLILIISITQMICLFWPKIWKWILPIQWLSFSITFFLEILYAALACENWDKIMLFGCVIKNKPICLRYCSSCIL